MRDLSRQSRVTEVVAVLSSTTVETVAVPFAKHGVAVTFAEAPLTRGEYAE